MATTYEAIATVTVGSGGAAEIEFTSIAADWTDLLVKISGRNTTTEAGINFTGIRMYPNGSTTSITSRTLYGTGSAAASDTDINATGGVVTSSNATASTFGNSEVYIPNYAGSANKSWSTDAVSENNATAAIQLIKANLWSNTAAITSLTFNLVTGNFAEHSTATLYGIKNT